MAKPLSISNLQARSIISQCILPAKTGSRSRLDSPSLLFCDLVLAGAVLHPSPSPLPYLQPSHLYTTGLPSNTDKIACLETKSGEFVPCRKQGESGLNHLKILSYTFRMQFVHSALYMELVLFLKTLGTRKGKVDHLQQSSSPLNPLPAQLLK